MSIDHRADEDRNMAAEAADGKNKQPTRDPRLDAIDAEDGFDEEYTFEYKQPAATPSVAVPVEQEADSGKADSELPISKPAPVTDDALESVTEPEAPSTSAADIASAFKMDQPIPSIDTGDQTDGTATSEPDDDIAAPRFDRISVPVMEVEIWEHAVVDPMRVAPKDIEQRAAEIEKMGQARPAHASVGQGGGVQILTRILDVLALKHLDAGRNVVRVELDFAMLTPEQMFRYAHLEGRGETSVVAYDRARSIRAALDRFGGTQKAIARTLGLDEATVTNSLHILKVEKTLSAVIADPWSITENQAKRFQKIWTDPVRRTEAKKLIADLDVGKARKHLSAVFAAFPTPAKNEVPIIDANGKPVGTIRPSAGRFVIKLDAVTASVPADELGAMIAFSIGALRK